MAQIHQLVTRREETSQETVEILENYLRMAKQGEIIAVAICAIAPNGDAIHEASATDHQITMLGAVNLLLHQMLVNAD